MFFDFEYADRRLSDFGCIVCHINTDAGVDDVELGSNITFNTITNSNSSIHSITSSSYEDVYTVEFEIMKYICGDADNIYLSSLEVRQLIKWLNRREYAKFRPINEISDESDVYYYGSFNIKQVQLGDQILGLHLTFTANAPYGFSEPNNLKYMILNDNDTFEIYPESDELGVIYPTVTIRLLYDGDIKIVNTTSGTATIIKNCKANETIIMDGEHKIITTDNEEHSSTLPNDFNYEYIDILIDEVYSPNIYQASKCEIFINYSSIRKVGGA